MKRTLKQEKQIKTAHTDETELLRGALELYNNGHPVDVDPCYSKGHVWRGLQGPVWKGDLVPSSDEVNNCDCRHLPFGDSSVGSVFFDPPFLPVGATKKGIMASRFTGFSTLQELYDMYEASLQEFKRILKKGGILIWKCQDIVNHDKQRMFHVWIINEAVKNGFEVLDLFILVRQQRLTSSKWIHQVHARKNHCYYIVLKKHNQKEQ